MSETPEHRLRKIEGRVERQIRELRESGDLRSLPGEGAPFPPDPDADAGDAWAARHLARTAKARPAWAELRLDIAERRERLIARLRAHERWLEQRRSLVARMSAERIVAEDAATREVDARTRRDVASGVQEINALVREHNLAVAVAALHLPLTTLAELLAVARAGSPAPGEPRDAPRG